MEGDCNDDISPTDSFLKGGDAFNEWPSPS